MNCRIFLKLQILCLTLKLISILSFKDGKYRDDRKEQKTGYKRVLILFLYKRKRYEISEFAKVLLFAQE
jgi:hypothetical protein